MSSVIDTKNVSGRRQLHFNCLEDIRADVEQLVKSKDIRTLGNWSAGQILEHLAIVMNSSIDGQPRVLPGIVRFALRLLMKRKLLTKPMAPGFQLPAKASPLLPPPATFEEGVQRILQALDRLQTETRRAPSAVVGPLSIEEWNQLHCRHAELHLSFLAPAT